MKTRFHVETLLVFLCHDIVFDSYALTSEAPQNVVCAVHGSEIGRPQTFRQSHQLNLNCHAVVILCVFLH